MSPDDHYADLKRIIAAIGGKARRITVVMPMLYEGRQHKRTGRESLDSATCLQELVGMGVDNIITFDAHDPRVQNAIPVHGFENVMPTYQMIKTLVNTEPDIQLDKEHLMIISPDEGAMARGIYFSSVLGVDLGMFYKRRDYSVVINGRNPIVAHEYLGADVAGKNLIIVDDMISSGDSVLDLAVKLKELKAKIDHIVEATSYFATAEHLGVETATVTEAEVVKTAKQDAEIQTAVYGKKVKEKWEGMVVEDQTVGEHVKTEYDAMIKAYQAANGGKKPKSQADLDKFVETHQEFDKINKIAKKYSETHKGQSLGKASADEARAFINTDGYEFKEGLVEDVKMQRMLADPSLGFAEADMSDKDARAVIEFLTSGKTDSEASPEVLANLEKARASVTEEEVSTYINSEEGKQSKSRIQTTAK